MNVCILMRNDSAINDTQRANNCVELCLKYWNQCHGVSMQWLFWHLFAVIHLMVVFRKRFRDILKCLFTWQSDSLLIRLKFRFFFSKSNSNWCFLHPNFFVRLSKNTCLDSDISISEKGKIWIIFRTLNRRINWWVYKFLVFCWINHLFHARYSINILHQYIVHDVQLYESRSPPTTLHNIINN